MLKLISISSSSKGNCNIVSNGKSAIMLDCGINMSKYNYDIQKYNVQGILLSHFHQDHIKGLKDKSCRLNCKVYGNDETIEFLGDSVMNYRKVVVDELKAYKIDEYWTIVPIELLHDVKNYGYIIKDNLTGLKIAYLTDLGYSENLYINGINVWIIECNHIRREVEEKYENAVYENDDRKSYFYRVLSDKGHLCLEDSCKLINQNFNYGLKCVILCHISSSEDDYIRYEELYQNELNDLETQNNGYKIHAINNRLKNIEEYDIVGENKWEKMIL